MSALTINGVTFPVARDSFSEEAEEIGKRGRSADGTPWSIIHDVKRKFSWTSAHLTLEESRFWEALFTAQGFTAGFESSTDTDQGYSSYVATGHGTKASRSTSNSLGSYSLFLRASTETSWKVGDAGGGANHLAQWLTGSNNGWSCIWRQHEDRDADAGSWQAETIFPSGAYIIAGGTVQCCTSGGGDYSGTIEPSWASTPGDETVDNYLTWTCVSASATGVMLANSSGSTQVTVPTTDTLQATPLAAGANATKLEFYPQVQDSFGAVDTYIDNMIFLNATLPTTYQTELATYIYTTEIPPLPFVAASGDLLESETINIQCRTTGKKFVNTVSGYRAILSVEGWAE